MPRLFAILLLFTPLAISAQGFLGPFEQEYFENAKAKNFAVIAARHCDKAEFYARQALEWMNEGKVGTVYARAYADSSITHINPALAWADSTLAHAEYADSTAIELVERSRYYLFRSRYALSLMRSSDKVPELDHYVWKGVSSVSHATIDAYHASLLLGDAVLQNLLTQNMLDSLDQGVDAEMMALLATGGNPPDLDKIERLEADEAAFTDLTNVYADQIKGKMDEIIKLQATIKVTTDPKVLTQLQQDLARLQGDKGLLESKLMDGTGQLQSIREIMSDSLVGNSGSAALVSEPGVFKPPVFVDNPDVDCDLPFPDGLVYKVQIGYFFPENEEDFTNFRPLTCEVISDKMVRYYAGEFITYKEASLAKNYLREHWFADAFVVPYFSGVKISTSEAIRLEWILAE